MKRLLAPFKKLGSPDGIALAGAGVFLGGVAWIFPPAALIIGGLLAMSYAAFLVIAR